MFACQDQAGTRKFPWGKVIGGAITIIGLVASIVGIATGMIPFIQARHDVDGTWTLKTQTENTTDAKYKGMEFSYTVNLTRDGTHVTGKGHKLGEKLVGGAYTQYEGRARTPIEIDGSLDGDSLDALFTEEGETRGTSGHLQLSWKRNSWEGTFNSEAAQSSGVVSMSPATE